MKNPRSSAYAWAVFLFSFLPVDSAPAQDDPQAGMAFTLMTYNIHMGVPMGSEIGSFPVREQEMLNIADVITSASPDIVALQEVDCEHGLTLPPERRRSSVINMPRVLSHLTGMSYVFGSTQDDFKYPSDNGRYVEWGQPDHWTNNREPHGEIGNAILSKHPFRIPPENIQLPRLPDKERRACLRLELSDEFTSSPAVPVIIYATHLQHDSSPSRAEQMNAILDRIENDPDDAVIFLMGDLNSKSTDEMTTVPEKHIDIAALALARGFFDLHKQHALETATRVSNTFRADNPDRRIDYILCNRKLRVLKAHVPRTLASDHLPLVVTVQLDPPT